MANSYVRYAGNGAQTNFSVTFPYIDKSHVSASVDGINAAVTWVNDTTVSISPAPANGTTVQLKRTTPSDAPLVDFQDGAILTEDQLDTNAKQDLYVAQETQDVANDAYALANDVIEEVEADRVAAEAAAAAAATSEANAATSATNAAASEATATTKASQASSSQTAAATSATNAATSATAAAASATSAASSATTAAATLNTYLGSGVEVVAPEAGLYGAVVSNDGKIVSSNLYGGDAGVEVVAPDDTLTGIVVSADGKVISSATPDTGGGGSAPTIPDQTSTAYFARGGARGIKVEAQADIKTASVAGAPYPGPRYDGAMWLAAPAVVGSNVVAKVDWEKKGLLWRDVTLGTNSLTLDGSMADLMFIFASFGQSLSVGNAPSYTDTAPDSTYLKMIGNANSFRHPYFPNNYTENGLVALSTDAARAPSWGETHLASMGLTVLAKMQAAGLKIPGVYFTCGLGGHSLRDLDEDDAAVTSQSRYGGGYANLIRLISYARLQILALGKIPVLAPVVFIHGEEDSADWNIGTTAKEYLAGLTKFRERLNRDVRRIFGWHRDAPGVPVLISQTRRTSPYMWSSGSKVFARGTDGPMLGQWAAPFADPGIVMCGPNFGITDLQGDGAHLNGTGYFRMGETYGRQLWNCLFGKGPSYFRPIAFTRQDASTVDLQFQLPSGTTLVLDATTIADHPDGNKGFYAWREDTGTNVAISSVAVQAADTIRITFTSPQTGVAGRVWIDGGLWGDTSSDTSQTLLGPRLCLRTDQTYPSIITSYGGSAVNNYDWCPAFRVPITYYGGSPRVGRLDGRL